MLGILISLIALLVGFPIAVVALFYKRQFGFWAKLGVPHTTPRCPLGDIGTMCFLKSPGEGIRDLYNKCQGHRFLGVWFWFTPTLIIRDLDLVRSVLVRDFNYFHDRVPYVNEKLDPLSGHLFSLRGSRWRNLRPKLSPAFSSGHLKNFFPQVVEYANELISLVENERTANEVIDMKEIAARFTTDVATAYSLGIRSNCLQNNEAPFRKIGRMVFAPTMFNCFRSLVPLLVSRLSKMLALRPTPKEVSDFFLDAVKKILEFRENSDESRDFFQHLIDLKKKGTIEIVDRANNSEISVVKNWKFSTNEAAAQAFIFFIAGFETSSSAIQYTLYELSLNQQIQQKLRSEITEILSKNCGKITYEAVNEMEYLNKVVLETLRKYPVVPLVFRTCTKNYQVPDSNLIIPKGVQVQISVYGIHRDPDYYPDPEIFDPERFSETEKSRRHNFAFLPFGDGPRNCLGMRFSLIQKKVGLIALLSKFKFEVCSQTPVPHVFNPNAFFFVPKGGMPLRISRL